MEAHILPMWLEFEMWFAVKKKIICALIFTLLTLRDLSVDLLRMIPDNHILLAKVCAFYPGSAAEINQLHERVSGPPVIYNK